MVFVFVFVLVDEQTISPKICRSSELYDLKPPVKTLPLFYYINGIMQIPEKYATPLMKEIQQGPFISQCDLKEARASLTCALAI